WFTENFPEIPLGSVAPAGKIGRITPAGALTEFPLPAPNSYPGALTLGPDGNLWFTENSPELPPESVSPADKTRRITPAGAITDFPLPARDGSPGDLMVGPDGNLWFTQYSISSAMPAVIGRITPAGAVSDFALSTAGDGLSGLTRLTLGPDGNLW